MSAAAAGAGGPGAGGAAAGGPGAGAGGPTDDNITCFMLFMVHGSVTLDANPLRLKVLVDFLNMIGADIDIYNLDLDLSEFLARVLWYVSPSNMGYSVMNSSNSRFPNYVEAFKHMVKADRDRTMNANKVSALLNFYDTRLYSFFGEHTAQERSNLETRFRARASDLNELDMTDKLLTHYPTGMVNHDFIARMRTIRNAIGLDWKPHSDYYIGNKLYCPGANANQCCLYFPKKLEQDVREKLQAQWGAFKLSRTETSIKKCAKDLTLIFTEDVLTIEFDINSDGVVKNTFWKGITLKQFFQQVTILLMKVFVGVEGFDVNQLMSRTCVVDTACSDFCVKQDEVLNEVLNEVLKEVSIISFEEDPIGRGCGGGGGGGGGGGVTASVYIRDPNDGSHLGFWEYLVKKKEMSAVGKVLSAEGRSKPDVVKICIPKELKEFVPCLTSLKATIKKVEPTFGVKGEVESVFYSYYDGTKELIDYTPSVPQPPTDSMETVAGSPPRDMMTLLADVAALDIGRIVLDDEISESLPSGDGDVDVGVDVDVGGGGRRRWSRTSKKKCMKKCKTKRRRQLRRQRCKTTQKNIVKSRRRRTCVRRL